MEGCAVLCIVVSANRELCLLFRKSRFRAVWYGQLRAQSQEDRTQVARGRAVWRSMSSRPVSLPVGPEDGKRGVQRRYALLVVFL